MTKKRVRTRSRPNLPAETVEAKLRQSEGAFPSHLPTSGDFRPDYSYVGHDLRRIALISASFILILLALARFLR